MPEVVKCGHQSFMCHACKAIVRYTREELSNAPVVARRGAEAIKVLWCPQCNSANEVG